MMPGKAPHSCQRQGLHSLEAGKRPESCLGKDRRQSQVPIFSRGESAGLKSDKHGDRHCHRTSLLAETIKAGTFKVLEDK